MTEAPPVEPVTEEPPPEPTPEPDAVEDVCPVCGRKGRAEGHH